MSSDSDLLIAIRRLEYERFAVTFNSRAPSRSSRVLQLSLHAHQLHRFFYTRPLRLKMSKLTTPATREHPPLSDHTSSTVLPNSFFTSLCLPRRTKQSLLETFFPPICLPTHAYVATGVRRNGIDGRCSNSGRINTLHITRSLFGAGAPCEEPAGLFSRSSA